MEATSELRHSILATGRGRMKINDQLAAMATVQQATLRWCCQRQHGHQ